MKGREKCQHSKDTLISCQITITNQFRRCIIYFSANQSSSEPWSLNSASEKNNIKVETNELDDGPTIVSFVPPHFPITASIMLLFL